MRKTFRIKNIVAATRKWGDIRFVDVPDAEQEYARALFRAGFQWTPTENPIVLAWDNIPDEDKPLLVPVIIHGLAREADDRLFRLIENMPLDETDLCALSIAVDDSPLGNAKRARQFLKRVGRPSEEEAVARLIKHPFYVRVLVRRVFRVPDVQLERAVAESVIDEIRDGARRMPLRWLRRVVQSGHQDLLERLRGTQAQYLLDELDAEDASSARAVFEQSSDEAARATALRTLVEAGATDAADLVRKAFNDPADEVKTTALDLAKRVLPAHEYATALVRLAKRDLQDHEVQAGLRDTIIRLIPEEILAEILTQYLR